LVRMLGHYLRTDRICGSSTYSKIRRSFAGGGVLLQQHCWILLRLRPCGYTDTCHV